MWKWVCVAVALTLVGCAGQQQREGTQRAELVIVVRSAEEEAPAEAGEREFLVEASVNTVFSPPSTYRVSGRIESIPREESQTMSMALRVGEGKEMPMHVSPGPGAQCLAAVLTPSGRLVFGTPVAGGLLLCAEIEAYDEATGEGTITVEFGMAGEGGPEFYVSEEHVPFRLGEPVICREYEGAASALAKHPGLEDF